jgi:hypothetical protein
MHEMHRFKQVLSANLKYTIIHDTENSSLITYVLGTGHFLLLGGPERKYSKFKIIFQGPIFEKENKFKTPSSNII